MKIDILDCFADLLKDEPAIITIMLGTNDCNPINNDAVRADYEKDYREMIELLAGLSSQPRLLLCYPPPLAAFPNNSDSLIRNFIIPIIDTLGRAYEIEVVDTYYRVDDYPANYSDKLHPDREGAVTLAEIIAEALGL